MSIRPAVRATPAYRFHEPSQRDLVKLDQNKSPWGPSDLLLARLSEELAGCRLNRYPEIHAQSLRAALAERLDWPADGVVVASGSNVLIQALVIAAGLAQTVLTVTPTFAVYPMQARLLGARLVEVPLGPGFALPLAPLAGEMARGRGVVFLASPAAPTGNLHPPEALAALLEAAGDDWVVVLDEAYHEFAGSDCRELIRRFPNAVGVRTLSKAFGLAGARLGYALCSADLAEQLTKVLLPFSVSALQLAASRTILDAPEIVAERVAVLRRERERVEAALAATPGVEAFPSVTNFVLFRVDDAAAVYHGLLERGVLIRRQDHLPGLAGCLRVSIGTPEDNNAFLAALDAVVSARPLRLGVGEEVGGA